MFYMVFVMTREIRVLVLLFMILCSMVFVMKR